MFMFYIASFCKEGKGPASMASSPSVVGQPSCTACLSAKRCLLGATCLTASALLSSATLRLGGAKTEANVGPCALPRDMASGLFGPIL